MSTNWRISSFNGALLAAYFIPTWAIIAYRIVLSPIHSFYERPTCRWRSSPATTCSWPRAEWCAPPGCWRWAGSPWCFFAVFAVLLTRSAIRKTGGSDEALCVALGIGSAICFAMMLMASLVHEVERCGFTRPNS